MIFQMQEGYLTLGEGDWQDSSVNMLGANHLPTKGTNLVITRESLPAGMGLADYLLNQKSILTKELTGFKILADNSDTINGLPAHFLEFTWNNQGNTMHQMLFIINNSGSVLNLTSSVPGNIDDGSRTTLMTAMKSFTVGNSPLEKKEI
jgi:hypothetical protein